MSNYYKKIRKSYRIIELVQQALLFTWHKCGEIKEECPHEYGIVALSSKAMTEGWIPAYAGITEVEPL